MGIDETRRQFDVTRADYQPYLAAGTQALSGMSGLLGLGGGEQQVQAIDALRASPLYQSLYRNGEEALLQNAAATGGIRGGNTARGLADFGADTLASTIQQQLANLNGVAGLGMGATNSVSGFGAQASGNITNLLDQQGAARAGNYLTRGGVNAQMWGNAGSFLDKAFGQDIKAGLASRGGLLAKLGGLF